MKIFSSLAGALISLSMRDATYELQTLLYKIYQFKHVVKDVHIISQELQISILLVVELTQHGAHHSTVITTQKSAL
jgi:hypothetical protein